MKPQKESPAQRCSAVGAGKAVSLSKGNYAMDITPFDAGRKASATFFAQHGHTLCVFRDLSRAAHLTDTPSPAPLKACQEFDAGFARGLAEMIAGVRHG